jgi:hypothetical protein
VPAVWTFEETAHAAWAGKKVLCEPFIQNYQKFNSNSGWNDDSKAWAKVMQALSRKFPAYFTLFPLAPTPRWLILCQTSATTSQEATMYCVISKAASTNMRLFCRTPSYCHGLESTASPTLVPRASAPFSVNIAATVTAGPTGPNLSTHGSTSTLCRERP